MQQDEWLSPDRAAEILGVTAESVRRLVRAGRLPGYRVGGTARGPLRINRSDLSKALVATAYGDKTN